MSGSTSNDHNPLALTISSAAAAILLAVFKQAVDFVSLHSCDLSGPTVLLSMLPGISMPAFLM